MPDDRAVAADGMQFPWKRPVGMSLGSFHRRVIAGEPALWKLPVRAALSLMSVLYGTAVRARNARFDRGASVHRAGAPVISVGNLTTGGTGKTPLVVALVERLSARGRRPAVLARGYGADGNGVNDEQRIIQLRCPDVIYVADKDRTRSARVAVEERGADVLILDDGFQHRRLARDIDLVLIDATCPFGFGRLIPRGLLREPLAGLRRASAVILTRADLVAPDVLDGLDDQLRRLVAPERVFHARHRVTGLTLLDGTPAPESLAGRAVLAFAAIGNPSAFRATLEGMGARIAAERWLPDHASYTDRELERLLSLADAVPVERLMTTEKDAVKLASCGKALGDRIRVVRISIELLDEEWAALDHLIEPLLAGHGK